jgi:hypothetical protein
MTRLDEIEARLAAAMGKPLDVTVHATRPTVTIQTSPEVWELIHAALSADVEALLKFARDVAPLAGTWADETGDVYDALRELEGQS